MEKLVIEIKKIVPTSSEVKQLIDELDSYQSNLYPSSSNHLDDIAELSKDNVYFVGAVKDKRLIAIGAVKKLSDYGELKRMYVISPCRGQNVAEALLVELENHLLRSGIFVARLETGIHQTAALRFYQRHQYKPCSPFGSYCEDPLSVFMEKHLKPPSCSLHM